MEGIVDVYLPDFKLRTSETARRYLKRADYRDVARETIVQMKRQVGDLVLDEQGMARRGLILRHLIMQGLLAETEAILRFVAEELGTGTYVNLMAQYCVSGKVGRNGEYDEIARYVRGVRSGRATHERFDGTGYPDGLGGEDIALEARIVNAADAFCAMTQTRPYREAKTVEGAVDELRRCAGTQFDPAVAEALIAVVREQQSELRGARGTAALGQ